MKMVFVEDVQDGDWFMIPVTKLEQFNRMEEVDEENEEFYMEFREYRIDHPSEYSFENPEEVDE